MSLFKNNKRRVPLASLILISFVIMAAFSIFLHDHELDPFTADEDCAPCHWTQTSISLDMDVPEATVESWIRTRRVNSERISFQKLLHTYFGRSPPFLFS